ncbi:MAG: hypothetical protein Q7K55_09480 [Candidatus Levybacteria bacterium]|nr:hypothetical protein [Candidatus Levybacteria bacterium]
MATQEQEDDQFFKGVGEQMEGYFPGLSERIDELNYQQLGRGIMIRKAERDPASQAKLVGYVLPLQSDQEKHLVILKNGTLFVIEPVHDPQMPGAIPVHKRDFSPSETRYEFPDFYNMAEVEQNLIELPGEKISLRNDNPENLPQIYEAMDQAISLAKELKGKRVQAKKESAQTLINKLDTFLNPSKPAGENSIPPIQPKDPSKPQEPPLGEPSS